MQTQPFSFHDLRLGTRKSSNPFAQKPAETPREEEAPPPPSYSQDELDAAIAKAREEGMTEGRAAEREAIDTEALRRQEMLAGLMTQLLEQLPALREQAAAAQQASLARVPEMALALAESIAGHALKHYPAEGLVAMIRETAELLQLPLEGFRLEAHPDTIAALENHPQVEALSELTVIANEAIPAGNGRLRWQGGHAEHDIAACVSRLQQLLQSFTAEPLDGDASNAT